MGADAAALFTAGLRRCVARALAREPELTRGELASRMMPACSPASAKSALRTYLAGGRQPRPATLDAMARGLGVEVAELFAVK